MKWTSNYCHPKSGITPTIHRTDSSHPVRSQPQKRPERQNFHEIVAIPRLVTVSFKVEPSCLMCAVLQATGPFHTVRMAGCSSREEWDSRNEVGFAADTQLLPGLHPFQACLDASRN
ncbi:unnamed protein product [Protopolystoma xenopodis]|uniref:Uncharacterized protein n=1 Tax=Protopolystoma xenopodis TaxID=117903 RepID=A0A448WIS5_9PLAT|nr:unnamed protein product [Protopolystoma xenopodis]